MQGSNYFPWTVAMWRRLACRRTALIGGFITFAFIGSYCLLRSYLADEAHRASAMFADLRAIKIGDSEQSVQDVIKRYGGFVEHSGSFDDVVYVVEVNPWHFATFGHRRRLDTAVSWFAEQIDRLPNFRRRLGIRFWRTAGKIYATANRVSAVDATALLEGRDEWLSGDWNLSRTMPRQIKEEYAEIKQPWPELNRYVVGWTHLDVGDGTGEGVRVWLTSSATASEMKSAREINLSCMVSSRVCRTLCELMPEAAKYHKQHAEASWGSTFQRFDCD